MFTITDDDRKRRAELKQKLASAKTRSKAREHNGTHGGASKAATALQSELMTMLGRKLNSMPEEDIEANINALNSVGPMMGAFKQSIQSLVAQAKMADDGLPTVTDTELLQNINSLAPELTKMAIAKHPEIENMLSGKCNTAATTAAAYTTNTATNTNTDTDTTTPLITESDPAVSKAVITDTSLQSSIYQQTAKSRQRHRKINKKYQKKVAIKK